MGDSGYGATRDARRGKKRSGNAVMEHRRRDGAWRRIMEF